MPEYDVDQAPPRPAEIADPGLQVRAGGRARMLTGELRWIGGYRNVRNGRVVGHCVIGGYGHERWEGAAGESIAYVARHGRHRRDVLYSRPG